MLMDGWMASRVIGILLGHLGAFGSGELKKSSHVFLCLVLLCPQGHNTVTPPAVRF